MAKIVNLYEAKSQLSSLVEEAASGTEVIIAKAGVPRARLGPIKAVARRRPGGSKGRIRIAADFDAPLPPRMLAAFTRRKLLPRRLSIQHDRLCVMVLPPAHPVVKGPPLATVP